MYVILKYKKSVPSNKLVDGKYIENNKIAISLFNDKITNPETSFNLLVIIFLLIIVGVTLLVYKKRKKELNVIIVCLLFIPICIYAIDKIHINITTKITIEEKYKVTYSFYNILTDSELKDYNNVIRQIYFKTPMSFTMPSHDVNFNLLYATRKKN